MVISRGKSNWLKILHCFAYCCICSSLRRGRSITTNLHNSKSSMSLLKMAKYVGDGLQNRIVEMEKQSKCKTCFLNNAICVCAKVKEIFEDSDQGVFNYDITVFMHSKEWGRASNTGKLLAIGMENASLSLYGVEADRIALHEKLDTTPSLILYPNKDAKPLSEYKEWVAQTGSAGERVTLCVIDSTWGQSVAMDKSLPKHIPRVKIDEMVSKPSLFLNRKQSKEREAAKRVSTVESVAMALAVLGEDDAAVAPLFKALELGVDAVLVQGGKPSMYGNKIIPRFLADPVSASAGELPTLPVGSFSGVHTKSSRNPSSAAPSTGGPFTKAAVERPPCCLHCGMLRDDAKFKNMGAHKRRLVVSDSGSSTSASSDSSSEISSSSSSNIRSNSSSNSSSNNSSNNSNNTSYISNASDISNSDSSGDGSVAPRVLQEGLDYVLKGGVQGHGTTKRTSRLVVKGEGRGWTDEMAGTGVGEKVLVQSFRVWRCSNCDRFFEHPSV